MLRYLRCAQVISGMGMVKEDCEVWVPSAEECEVIHILSNLGDYSIQSGREVAVIDKAENMENLIPPRAGPYSQLRGSRNIPRIASPCWKPKMMRPIVTRTLRCAANPYAGAVGDGKMYVSQLPKHLERPTTPTILATDTAINLEEHQGWERLDFSVDGEDSIAVEQ